MRRDDLSLRFAVGDPSGVGECRRRVEALGDAAGVPTLVVANAGLAVTEAGTNLIAHAGGGEIVARVVPAERGAPGLEFVALDRGPGISDVHRALSDGYSTAGTSGTGLGAIRRLASEFDIYTRPRAGTALVARFHARLPLGTPAAPRTGLRVGAICEPQPDETACGDGWSVCQRTRQVMVLDGLGHGDGAEEAAIVALGAFRSMLGERIADQLRALDDALRSTRGAAIALAHFRPGSVDFVGAGNITAYVNGPQRRIGLVSTRGIVGHRLGRVYETTTPVEDDDVLILHSDGLRERWSLTDYPGVWRHDPTLVAALLFRDYRRDRDDATIVVVRPRDDDGTER